MLNKLLAGLKEVATPKGLGMAVGVVLLLTALYAFAPGYTPQALATRVKG